MKKKLSSLAIKRIASICNNWHFRKYNHNWLSLSWTPSLGSSLPGNVEFLNDHTTDFSEQIFLRESIISFLKEKDFFSKHIKIFPFALLSLWSGSKFKSNN